MTIPDWHVVLVELPFDVVLEEEELLAGAPAGAVPPPISRSVPALLELVNHVSLPSEAGWSIEVVP